jgi:hypothetical protein
MIVRQEWIREHDPVRADGAKSGVSPLRVKEILLLLLVAAHAVWSVTTIIPGYLLIDEALYHWMSRSFSDTWGLALWTGYGEFPSVEFLHRHTRLHDGRVFAQYPHFFTVVSWPLYRLIGLSGLFMTNTLSFLGVIALCYATARRLFVDRDLAVNSCLILGLATFSWEYSQAAWPHTTSTLFVLGAFYLGLRSQDAASARDALFLALASGLTAGFGTGIRMDVFLIIPCVLFFLLFRSSPRTSLAAVFVLGAIPGLAALAYTNHIKFGVLSPFSYGDTKVGFLQTLPPPLVGAALALALGLWGASRPSVRNRRRSGLGRFHALIFPALILTAAAVAAHSYPGELSLVKRILRTCYEAVIDIRAIDPGVVWPSMSRSQGGGVIYVGAHKKALLQSLPYLMLLIIPLVLLIRSRAERYRLSPLFTVPAAFIALHSYLISEHGGLGLNYRYFLPLLPFTSILCAYAWAKLNQDWRRPAGYTSLMLAAVLTAAAFAGFMHSFLTLESLEFPLLMLPHLMAVSILAFLVAGYIVRTDGVSPLRIACMASIVAAMTWSLLTAFFYDYARHRDVRLQGYITDQNVLTKVPPDSLFISAPYLGPSLIEGPRIRIAFPGMDKGKDVPRLIAFHLNAGRRVFGVFSKPLIEHILKAEISDYKVKPMVFLPGGFDALAELVPAPKADDDRPGGEDSPEK